VNYSDAVWPDDWTTAYSGERYFMRIPTYWAEPVFVRPSWWRWYDALREWPKPTTLRPLKGMLTKPRRCQQPTSLAKRRKQKRRAWLHAIYAR
jgi:hypothetical protein